MPKSPWLRHHHANWLAVGQGKVWSSLGELYLHLPASASMGADHLLRLQGLVSNLHAIAARHGLTLHPR